MFLTLIAHTTAVFSGQCGLFTYDHVYSGTVQGLILSAAIWLEETFIAGWTFLKHLSAPVLVFAVFNCCVAAIALAYVLSSLPCCSKKRHSSINAGHPIDDDLPSPEVALKTYLRDLPEIEWGYDCLTKPPSLFPVQVNTMLVRMQIIRLFSNSKLLPNFLLHCRRPLPLALLLMRGNPGFRLEFRYQASSNQRGS